MADAESKKSLNAFVVPLLFASCCGSSTTGDWKAAETADGSIAAVTSWLGAAAPWAGSLLLGLAGAIGVFYLARRITLRRGWPIVAVGVLTDWLLTALLLLPLQEYTFRNPLGPWPFFLGSFATFLSGMLMGVLASPAPLTFGCGIASVDLLVSGLLGVVQPQALTVRLVSRMIVAYSSAGFGALVGRNVVFTVVRDRESIGRFLAMMASQIAIAGVGGAVTLVLVNYFER